MQFLNEEETTVPLEPFGIYFFLSPGFEDMA
jgi:hypothetical protein